MPYTPPSSLSPAASTQTSPAPSRSHSYLKGQTSPELSSSTRASLPRSSGSQSYLAKHRRSPSLTEARKDVVQNGEAYAENRNFDPHGSLRQSPPPANNSLIPTGMTISPPDSLHNSSDEEDNRVRGRSLDIENLEELQAAISVIHQRKEGSPDRTRNEGPRAHFGMNLVTPQIDRTQSTPNFSDHASPLSPEARKISHSRSSTDSSIVFDSPQRIPQPLPLRERSDSDSDDMVMPPTNRPAMVRKKSGELVRPALRPSSSRRRPSSMPGTPTYSKAVHFDSHLEHVRHFLQVDRPLAVSAGSSPAEPYESESEFPFSSDDSSSRSKSPIYEWEIRLSNFPADTEERKVQPVRVERVFLSSDNKNLVGVIAVQNIAFQKLVVTRFTLDYWKTTSEVVADYNHDVRRKQNDGCDRFNFSVKLADQAHLASKTMFFCVRYQVNGQEYWDNNNGYNYQVDFSKKSKSSGNKAPATGLGVRPIHTLPRSRPSPPTSGGARPKFVATSFDDFTTGFNDNFSLFTQSPTALIGEPKIKLRSRQNSVEFVPESPAPRPKSAGQAFGNRYDFNSSLSAAKSHALAILGEQSGLSSWSDTKQSSRDVPATTTPTKRDIGVNGMTNGAIIDAPSVDPMTPKPAALVSQDKPSVTSQSYQELVDKYCFFGTPRSPPLTQTALSMMDGSSDNTSISDFSTGSARSSNSTGTNTPTLQRSLSPSPPETSIKSTNHSMQSPSPLSRSNSRYGSGSNSPVAFGYPYRSQVHHTLMSETPTPTAIRG